MDEVREGLLYTESHEWVQDMGGGKVRLGITDHAQHELGDIVFVEVPDAGSEVVKGDEIGALESVKTVEPVHSPFSGEVIEANPYLEEQPELMNRSPYSDGWLVDMRLSDPTELQALMDDVSYAKLLEE